MAYTKTNWENLPSTNTPVTATNLNNIENGIKENDNKLLGTSVAGNMVVESVKSKNIFDGILELGSFTNNGAKTPNNEQYRTCNYIAVLPNEEYTISINGTPQQYVMNYYDNNQTFLSSGDNRTGTFTTPNNCYFVTFRCYVADFRSDFATLKVQVEKGTTATAYTPYQELNNQDKYSVAEIKIGTWIDGKPLYRKVINNTSDASSNEKTIYTFSEDVNVINIYGFLHNPNTKETVPVNNYYSSSYTSNLFYINKVVKSKVAGYYSYNLTAILEYTKSS